MYWLVRVFPSFTDYQEPPSWLLLQGLQSALMFPPKKQPWQFSCRFMDSINIFQLLESEMITGLV